MFLFYLLKNCFSTGKLVLPPSSFNVFPFNIFQFGHFGRQAKTHTCWCLQQGTAAHRWKQLEAIMMFVISLSLQWILFLIGCTNGASVRSYPNFDYGEPITRLGNFMLGKLSRINWIEQMSFILQRAKPTRNSCSLPSSGAHPATLACWPTCLGACWSLDWTLEAVPKQSFQWGERPPGVSTSRRASTPNATSATTLCSEFTEDVASLWIT